MARPGLCHRKPFRSLLLLGAALTGVACSGGQTFVRPGAAARQVIRNEATGQTYDDCKKAFAEATTDTVLSFSEGLFPCGEEVSAAADWLVVRGAGMGHTYLEYGDPVTDPPKPLRLTSLTPKKYLRVEELSFGGLTDLPGQEGRAELVRVAIATERTALIGGPTATMEGSAVIVHSVLAGWIGKRPADKAPKPLAIGGTGRVAVIESVVYDVEQEFERYPAPGSVVILSDGFEKAFASHDPASKLRTDPSPRANLACGHKSNPHVACASEGQSPDGDGPAFGPAKALQSGASLAAVEGQLREAGKGFVDRFGRSLGAGIRQPDVYWFDDASAQMVQDGANANASDLLPVLVRPRTSAVIALCARTDLTGEQVAQALETARTIDHLLGASTTENACKEAVKTRVQGLLESCKTTWEWEKAVGALTVVDTALKTGSENTDVCRKALSARVDDFDGRGDLAEFLMQEVGRSLQVDTRPKGTAIPSLKAVVKQLPWIHLRAGRTLPHANPPGIMDHLLHAAEAVGAGDGRELVETTAPCSLTIAGVSTRASATIQLGEMPPHPKVGQTPHTVVEVPIQVTQSDLVGVTYEGSTDSALLQKCDQKTNPSFQIALRKYFTEELQRLLNTATGQLRTEVEVLLQMLQAESGEKIVFKKQTVPTVPQALAKLTAAISSQPLDAAPLVSKTEESPLLLRPPPDWSLKDLDTAADQLAKAPAATLDACELAMPDVPWHKEREGTSVRGGLTVDHTPVLIRCVPGDKAFELALRPANEGDIGPKLIDGLMRSLSSHLGWPKPKDMPTGEAMMWPAKAGRSALLYKKARTNADIASVQITLGSTWAK